MTHPVIQYSARIGHDPHMVQGAGGNVSWKEGNTMWVKASGTWLSDAEQKDIFVPVDLAAIRADITNGDYSKPAVALTQNGLRPSIETILHALMPQSVVVHTHPVQALPWLVQANAEERLRQALGTRFNWAITGYHKPGAALAQGVHEAIKAQLVTPEIVFLGNHGVIVGGETTRVVEDIYIALLDALQIDPRALPAMAVGIAEAPECYRSIDDADIRSLAFDITNTRLLDTHWALYPDHVVFLGSNPPVFGTLEEFKRYLQDGDQPDYAIIRQAGVLVRDGVEQNKIAMLKCFAEVARRLDPDDSLNTLTEEDIGALLNWDAEKYRKQHAR